MKSPMKIYISGPITGVDNPAAAFEKAEKIIRKKYSYAKVENPITFCNHLDPETTPWADYMDICLEKIWECTHIFMLPGWEDSRGARVEKKVAEILGIAQL